MDKEFLQLALHSNQKIALIVLYPWRANKAKAKETPTASSISYLENKNVQLSKSYPWFIRYKHNDWQVMKMMFVLLIKVYKN